jgi:hypothetical protein
VIKMYLGVAGACAEQKANASVTAYTLEGITFQDVGLATGLTPVELLNSPTEMVLAHEGGSSEKVHSYTFDDDAVPNFGSISDTISLSNKNPRALCFGDNGGYLLIGGTVASSNVVRYTLTTAYDIGTASASTQKVNSSLYNSGAQGLAFNNDGTKLFIADGGSVTTLNLTTAYDLSAGTKATNSFTSTNDSDGDSINNFTGIRFNPDGTKMFLSYRNSSGNPASGTQYHPKIAEFDLTTGFLVSTATFVRSISVNADIGQFSATVSTLIAGFDWNSDGTKLYVAAVHPDKSVDPIGIGPKVARYSFS